jgi:hypothetical protein
MISPKALGLIFLVITSAAWIGASFITQALVSRGEEEPAALEPWLLTLICSSTLMLYLPIGHFARKRARYEGRARASRSPRPRTRQRKSPPVGTSDDVAFEHATGCLHPRRRLVLLLYRLPLASLAWPRSVKLLVRSTTAALSRCARLHAPPPAPTCPRRTTFRRAAPISSRPCTELPPRRQRRR